MNRDDILRTAREAGLMGNPLVYADWYTESLERFFQLAYNAGAAAEREACAKTIEQCVWPKWAECGDKREVFAAAIRARGNT